MRIAIHSAPLSCVCIAAFLPVKLRASTEPHPTNRHETPSPLCMADLWPRAIRRAGGLKKGGSSPAAGSLLPFCVTGPRSIARKTEDLSLSPPGEINPRDGEGSPAPPPLFDR